MSRTKIEGPDLEPHVALCVTCGAVAATFSEPCEAPTAARMSPALVEKIRDISARTGWPAEDTAAGLLACGLFAVTGDPDARLDVARLKRALAGSEDDLKGDPPLEGASVTSSPAIG